MTRVLLYVFPLLIDMALGCAWYVCTARRALEPEATAGDVAWLLTLWAVTYMVVCRLIGHILTDRNALALVVVGAVSVTAVAAGFILVADIGQMWWLLMLQAIAVSLFFVPFQVLLKRVAGGGESGIVRPTALYTAAWSLGLAAGPFVGAWLWNLWGWQAAYGINIVVGVVTAVGIVLLYGRAERPAAEAAGLPVPSDRYTGLPDLAWLAWVGSGAGFVAAAMIRALLPTATKADGISTTHLGMILAVLALSHSATALALVFSRFWMYRPRAIAAFALSGLVGLGLFAAAHHLAIYYAAAVCFGVYSAAFCFYAVFHALVHPSKSSSYVAANETMVGLTAIIGPFVGGRLADATHSPAVPLWAAAALVAAAVALQMIIHARHARRLPAGEIRRRDVV